MIELARIDPGFAQAVRNGVAGEPIIMLAAGEPFLLGRGDNLAVRQESGRTVVIKRRDAENVHGPTPRCPITTSATARTAEPDRSPHYLYSDTRKPELTLRSGSTRSFPAPAAFTLCVAGHGDRISSHALSNA